MDRHRRELARSLFVLATEMLEDAHATAIAGQSPKLSTGLCKELASRLGNVGSDLSALAACVGVIVRSEDGDARFSSQARSPKKIRK
jgi:hypothetical protein